MEPLKYKLIKTKSQYKLYCKTLEELVDVHPKNSTINDEIELLSLLIEKWDADHTTATALDPIELLQALLKDHQLRAADLANILQVSKGYVSDILHYKKGLSKEVIRTLAAYFKVSQEAFNRHYELNRTVTVQLSKKKTA